MKRILLSLMLTIATLAYGGELPSPLQIGDIEGVYKHRFMNGVITPGKAPGEADQPYQSEDIIEIVQYDPSHVYFRAELQFYNGHSCSIYGIAGQEKDGFVYHDPAPPLAGEPACTLKLSGTADQLHITDRITPTGVATCRMYCGARGSLSDYLIARSAKRKIRYLDRLKASREYLDAVKSFTASKTASTDTAARK